MVKRVIAGAAALIFLIALVAAVGVGSLLSNLVGAPAPSSVATVDIPPAYLALYEEAAGDCPGLDWTVLAAVGKVETDHGRSPLPGVASGENAAGAGGPMQFLQATFDTVTAHHPLSPTGGGAPSRYDPHDAIHAAAHDLCDHGAPTNIRAALLAYNHSDAYVTAVLAQADQYRAAAVIRREWPPEDATVPDPSGTGGHVTPRTATLYQVLAAADAIREGATCWDPHPQNPDSDHPRGKACDVFFHPTDPTDIARGWNIALWLTTHQTVYGIHYVIWQGLIWTAENPTWMTYQSTVYGCPNPTHITGCHFDHIHASLY